MATFTTTLRNYISLTELARLASIVITNNGEALRQIDRAEQAIDDYVGYQCKSVETEFQGVVSATDSKVVIDQNPASQLHQIDGYFARCVIEILGGTGARQLRYISDSSYDNRSVTIVDDWDVVPDTTSFYRIYQLAKYPRDRDMYVRQDGRHYYKAVPDAIKQAMVAQIQYMIEQGDAFFVGNQADITSEQIGNYSYSKANGGQSPIVTGLAPRARALLRGYKNSMGHLSAENPTYL